MTIEDIFKRGEISLLTRNICMANKIKTLLDLRLHYDKRETFRNLLYCDEKSNDELTAIYNKYNDVYVEDKSTQPVSENKSVHYVSKPSELLGELEQRFEDYWKEKANKKTSKIDMPESFVKATSRVYSTDYKNVNQNPKYHWRKSAVEIAEKKAAKSKTTFERHPSKRLNDLYAVKSYQGANPIDAKVIFVRRDLNWPADIEDRKMFENVVDYLTDGIGFWEKHTVHHPFLLSGYKGYGRKYQRSFSKLNLDSSVASKISFVELIGFPTTGMAVSHRSSYTEYLFSEDNREHLIELDRLLSNNDKIIFIAWGLINDFKLINKQIGLFERLAKLDKSKMDVTDLNQYENIFIHQHFADAINNATIAKMEARVRENLK